MWPGDQQSGGERCPQGDPPTTPRYSRPFRQPPPPGPPPRSPYAPPPSAGPNEDHGHARQPAQGHPPQQPRTPYQPGPYRQPAPGFGPPTPPYPHPAGHPQWRFGPGTPPPGLPPQGGGRNRTTVVLSVVAAVAVTAAVGVGVTVLTGGGGGRPAAKDTTAATTATRAAAPSPSAPRSDDGGQTDNPRGAPDSVGVKSVIPGWKVVRGGERNVAFDVPPDWTVDAESMSIGFEDDNGKPQEVMSSPAYYQHDWCDPGDSVGADRGAVGTKGAAGAGSLREAAETEAASWAYWAYQDKGKGTFSKAEDSRAFHNDHGISGWQAQATATGLPKADKCSPPGGIAYTVAWMDPSQRLPTPVVWVLYADTGMNDQLAQSVVDRIKSTIRPLKD